MKQELLCQVVFFQWYHLQKKQQHQKSRSARVVWIRIHHSKAVLDVKSSMPHTGNGGGVWWEGQGVDQWTWNWIYTVVQECRSTRSHCTSVSHLQIENWISTNLACTISSPSAMAMIHGHPFRKHHCRLEFKVQGSQARSHLTLNWPLNHHMCNKIFYYIEYSKW